MTRKKLFGKRLVALMTTFAVLVSLVAMLSGIAVNATSDYTPKRVLSMTNTSNTAGRIALCSAADAVGAGTVVTIKGYYKVEGFTPVEGQTCYGYVNMGTDTYNADVAAIYADTDGWKSFEITDYSATNDADGWLQFGFTNATGTFSVADVTMVNADGEVVYDMATDTAMAGATGQNGIWWMSADAYSLDPAVPSDEGNEEQPYAPKRVISMTTAGAQINGKIYLYNSNYLGAGQTVTAKGYYKVENYTVADENQNPKIISTFGDITDNCDWTPFEVTFETGEGAKLALEFWYTQGTVSFADVTIADKTGTYIYDMTADDKLVPGTYNADNWAVYQDMWYFGFYGNIDQATYTIGDVVEGGVVVVPPPYDPNLVALPEVPNLLEPDATGYAPNRAFAILNTNYYDAGDPLNIPNVVFSAWADEYFLDSDKYYVFAKVKVDGYELYSTEDAAMNQGCIVQLNAGEYPTQVLTNIQADTDGWVTVTGEFGKLTDADSVVLKFAVRNAKANFIIGDVIFADAEGNIVYSLANDKTMHIESDMRYTTSANWNATPFSVDPAKHTPVLFPIQTQTDEYKPNAVISITANDNKRGNSAESFLFLPTNNALFTAGQTYTIKGMVMVDIVCGYGGWTNPQLSIGASLGTTQVNGVTINDANTTWLPLLAADGSALTFTATGSEDWVKFNMFKTYGTLALADIQIVDAQGNVVYDMAADEELKAIAGAFADHIDTNVAPLGKVFKHALYNNGVGEVWFSETVNENSPASMQIPTFVESVEVPEIPETSAPETSAPEATTEAPEATTEAPEATTEAPEATTEAPEATTEAPEVTTEAPEATTEAPEATTEAPEATTEAPEVTTEAPEATTEAPEESKPEEVTEITIKVEVPEGWENPGIWAWDNSGKNAFDAWPGLSLTKGDDGFWYATIPAWVENIIINANGGSVQTADLALAQTKVDVTVSVSLGADGKAEAALEYGALTSPDTGDAGILYAVATAVVSAMSMACITLKKKEF